jgi:hypothetical protein
MRLCLVVVGGPLKGFPHTALFQAGDGGPALAVQSFVVPHIMFCQTPTPSTCSVSCYPVPCIMCLMFHEFGSISYFPFCARYRMSARTTPTAKVLADGLVATRHAVSYLPQCEQVHFR